MSVYFKVILLVLITYSVDCQSDESSVSYSVGSQEVSIAIDDSIMLSGTLEYASQEKLVIMIAGSGPTDRDCNSAMGFKSDAFKMLARQFAIHNISSYRYDKRGVGKSTKVSEATMTFQGFVNDVQFIVDQFKNDFKHIVLLGHSEGALIGAIAAQGNKNVDQFISASGTSVSLDKIVMDQISQYPKLIDLAQTHIDEIKAGKELSEVHPILRSLFRPSVVPFLNSVFAIDPLIEIAKVTQATLIISGECDLQVAPVHAENMYEARPQSQLVIIPEMGHVLKKLDEDCSNARLAYSDATMPLNQILLDNLISFITDY